MKHLTGQFKQIVAHAKYVILTQQQGSIEFYKLQRWL